MKWLPAVVLFFLGTLPLQAQGGGSIRGIVLSEAGIPMKGIKVRVNNNRPLAGRPAGVPAVLTDETGHFVIQNVPFDEYEVVAYDEEQNYPEGFEGGWLLFYKKPAWPKVNLTAQEPTAVVEVRLGRKTAAIVGTISDAITGAPLYACAGFSPASKPISSTAYPVYPNYRLLIPADSEVGVKVWLEGYKPWYYPGTDRQSARTSIHLKPGEEMKLNIHLRPKKDARAAWCGVQTY